MKRSKQAGQSLILVALALTVLAGFAGLAIDMGVLRYERRLQQAAADGAALAGASDLPYGHAAAVAAASSAATANGFSDNTGAQNTHCGTSSPAGCIAVTVNNPPTSGPHNGNSNYVEVYVTDTQPTFFMRLLGANYEAVAARAVAGDVGGGGACLYALGTPGASIEGISIKGNATLDATGCSIVDNGDFDTSGNALTVNAYSFGCGGTAAFVQPRPPAQRQPCPRQETRCLN